MQIQLNSSFLFKTFKYQVKTHSASRRLISAIHVLANENAYDRHQLHDGMAEFRREKALMLVQSHEVTCKTCQYGVFGPKVILIVKDNIYYDN